MITSNAPDNLMFCTMTSIPGIQQVSSGKWELDHVERTRECGWYKTHLKAMPKVPIDIEVMTDEQAILHPKSLFKTKHTNTSIAHSWHCTPDTGAQVTVSGPALLTRFNVREADLIPVTQKVTTANDVPLTILGAVIVKLTSVSTPRRTTLQLCYIGKECHGMYLSLSACKNLGTVHAAFPEPIVKS